MLDMSSLKKQLLQTPLDVGQHNSHKRIFRISKARRIEAIAEPVLRPQAGLPSQGNVSVFQEKLLQDRSSLQQLKEKKVEEVVFDHEPSEGWQPYPGYLSKQEVWDTMRGEAVDGALSEPALASFLHSTILAHTSIEKTLAFILANKLASETLLGTHLMRQLIDAYEEEPEIVECMLADVQAVYERDPACDKFITPLLFFKGFQAIQSYRIAHYLWSKNRRSLALAIQSRISDVFHVDIHPAAKIGKGVLVDHATGVVIGETAVVGDNVSMLHHVTLGGSGCHRNGQRHPTIGHGVLLGAGVCVLGPVLIGNGSKVGAGSVVVSSIPCHSVAVGVPAKVIKRIPKCEPCLNMDQTLDFILDFQI
eukprot:TRINITY_DN29448_c0_g1_i1.p1 TRINITY_DN29448_c0_g1~~TRINITY_DN29448_c0_g1_i1.p1  ORF type:complete len:364 (+),score=44.30 TRINITY_DN29448_c0_g1_i1:110-1201(+)